MWRSFSLGPEWGGAPSYSPACGVGDWGGASPLTPFHFFTWRVCFRMEAGRGHAVGALLASDSCH